MKPSRAYRYLREVIPSTCPLPARPPHRDPLSYCGVLCRGRCPVIASITYFHFETIERAGGVRGYCGLFVHSSPAYNVTDRACYGFASASVTQLEPKTDVVSMNRVIEVPGSGMGGMEVFKDLATPYIEWIMKERARIVSNKDQKVPSYTTGQSALKSKDYGGGRSDLLVDGLVSKYLCNYSRKHTDASTWLELWNCHRSPHQGRSSDSRSSLRKCVSNSSLTEHGPPAYQSEPSSVAIEFT